VVAAALPLTSNGKLDRAAVRALAVAPDGAQGSADPPQGDVEAMLAEIWQGVLGRPAIGRHQTFVSLGGDSIKAIQVLARLRARGRTLELRDLMRTPTIAELAPRVVERRRPAEARAEPAVPFSLTPIQRRFFEMHADAGAHFNHAWLLRLRGRVDPERLRQALQVIQDTHAALRLRFRRGADGGWTQTSEPTGEPVVFAAIDVSAAPDVEAEIYARSSVDQTGMDLTAGPLFRGTLFNAADADRLLLVAHHLVVDGVTWRLLLEDLETLLEGGTIQPPSHSFREWSAALHDPAFHRGLADEGPLWAAIDQTPSAWFDDHDVESGTYGEAAEELVEWHEDRTRALTGRACAAYQTNAGELLLAAVARALGRWTRRTQLLVALEQHGRDAVDGLDFTRTAGWFTTLYPFALDLAEGPVGRRIKQLKERWRRVPRAGVGYGVTRYLAPDLASESLAARPNVSFNYLGELGGGAPRVLEPCDARLWPSVNPGARRPFALEIAALVIHGRLRLSIVYPGRHVDRAGMHGLCTAIDEELGAVVDHCLSRAATELTPSDLTHKALSLEELDELFDED
jgi:non-ribosomal peptide synthase protein (TIGR01720 family)